MSVFRLDSAIQPYAWGSTTAIADYLGRPASGGPEAELWMGAHEKSPSALVHGPEPDLARLLESAPERYLGRTIVERYGRLPFLFKVLAAEEPLSLQAHPSKEQARAGFEREEALGPGIGDPTRNYRDPSDKPELICALTNFFALSGFREFPEARSLLEEIAAAGARSQVEGFFAPFLSSADSKGLRRLLEHGFSLPRGGLRTTVSEIRRSMEQRLREARPSNSLREFSPWFSRLAEHYPDDPGVLFSLMLNFVQLRPGDAMFLPAGNLHAYLFGLGLEVMANSDNVLRGGLTQKHVDVAELCDVLSFDSFLPAVSSGKRIETAGGTRLRYDVPVPEFCLEILEPDAGLPVEGPAIALVLDGQATVAKMSLNKGEQVFIGHDDQAVISGPAKVAMVSAPQLV